MKLNIDTTRKPRIDMLPLIDIVFLLLVFFIYAMLSMAVHRALPVDLPVSSTAQIDKHQLLSVTIEKTGAVFLDKVPVGLDHLSDEIQRKKGKDKEAGVLLFADAAITYQTLFTVIDQIKMAGIHRISLESEKEKSN